MKFKLIDIISALVMVASLFLGLEIFFASKENQVLKQDYAEINHIKYGLFSINEWKVKLSDILNNEINNLDIRENKEQLKPVIEAQLNQLIDGVNQKIKEKNKKTFKGHIKQAFINAFVDVKEIKEGIPQYADEIIKLMNKPKNKGKIKGMIQDKVDDYFDRTFEEQDLSEIDMILARTGQKNVTEAKAYLDLEILNIENYIAMLSWILIAGSTALFIVAGFSKLPLSSERYIMLVGTLFILLFTGVTTPMIDLEAKISEMSFMLFDQPIKFLNQVLYFQTKSVLDVFWIMITHHQLQMKVVGLLMVTFSVIFPVTKLISSVLYYYNFRKYRDNKLVQFFVLKSGKWSMTDVMIIAIFMAYIGFNGVISSQLGKMHETDSEIVLLTTNGTSLQPGFYLFMTYALLALFLSEFLVKSKTATKA